MKPKLFLIDAMGLIFRAYYAMIKSPRFTSKGLNTSAILGFTNMFYEIIKNEKPTHIAVAFDTGAPTFRHADFEDYKANREATPDEIIASVPYIQRILDAFRVTMVAMDGYEADDIVGTLAKHAEIEGFDVYMMTSDKDYGQLVSPNIKMYRPGKFGQQAEILGPEEICAKYKIKRPEQLIDILGLQGDSSDNIPGVPGVGPVTAQKLLANYDSIENMYACGINLDKEKQRQHLLEFKEQAFLSKQLATIMIDVPIECDFEEMAYKGPDPVKLKAIFTELEFKALSQRIFTDLSLKKQPAAEFDLFNQNVDVPESGQTDLFQEEDILLPKIIQIESLEQIQNSKFKIQKSNGQQPIASSQCFFDWIMQDGKIAGFAFAMDDKTCYYHFVESEHRHYQQLIQWIFTGEHTVVTYESKPTYKYLKAFKIEPTAKIFDLQIAHYLIQPENQHNLERISNAYLNYSLKSSSAALQDVAVERVSAYVKILPLLQKELVDNQLQKLFDTVEMPLVPVLADMERAGVRIDVPTLQKNSETMKAELQELEKQIYDYAGVQFNIGSPKQLGEVLFERMRIIENAKLTKSKQYQTGEEVLLKLAHKHPIVPLILEWRKLSKLKSTYIDALPQLINPKTGRIHTTFTQTITSTGRLSSVNPNLQNIPVRTERGRDIRKAFVATDDEHVILAADYSQIELRIVAHVCGDERMIDTFRKNEDIHAAMAAHIFGVPQDEVTKDMRRSAKTVNFGILYGISAFGLADRLQIPQGEARQLIEDYFRSFPKISDYLNDTLEFARKNLYVETLLGRRRYIRDINAQNGILRKAAERNAINAPIQGTAADLIKIAMIDIHREMRELNLRSKMILQVHDELVFDARKDELDALKPLVVKHMSGAMQLSVPLDVDINEGTSWFEAH
ncbi:MAG: DNA polymerase I [Bacteroidales bacterium]|nr:DNA polymerase I [Bacteroidales bacterium]